MIYHSSHYVIESRKVAWGPKDPPPPCIIGLMTLDSLDSLDGPKTARTGRSTFFQAKIVHPILIFLNILSSKAKQNCLNSKNP